MPLRIVVVPASTKAGRETIRRLLESENKPHVRGIYRDTSKVPSDFTQNPNFEATEGDVGTGAGLDFTSADAVFYIPPPTYDGTDQGEWAARCANNVKNAIQNAPSVTRLLLFSALGAQHDHGTGIIRLNHISDTILKDAAREVIMVRPSFFHDFFAHALEEARADPPVVHTWITPVDHKIPMVSLKDIAKVCANALLAESGKPSPYSFKLFGPRHYSALDLKEAVEQVTGRKVELKPVERDQLAGFAGLQIPEPHVQEVVDMIIGVLPGGISEAEGDFDDDENTVRGETELVDSLRELAAKATGK
ncbi:hypothetical protein C8A03DRAFT_15684 [Achaetomium macrosporum]|uniref:NAD(P)-binding domain-containing protein n=1 Tax=Achaetomium macrosporum TaxID=79813 RepID=A0AAN7HBV9_9PEZI|nr:hypothetical protein C8A03DRAFT_15684 [Achaetomium macrosporum]